MSMADNLKHWRQVRGLTQPELAERAEIEQSYLSKLENDRSKASDAVLERLAAALEIDGETLAKDPTRNGHLRRIAAFAVGGSILLGVGFLAGYSLQDYEVRKVSGESKRLEAIWAAIPEDTHVKSIQRIPDGYRITGRFEDPRTVRMLASRLLELEALGDTLNAIHLEKEDSVFQIDFSGELRRPFAIDELKIHGQRSNTSSDSEADEKS